MKAYGTLANDRPINFKKGCRTKNDMKGKWSRTEKNNFERIFKKRTRFEAKNKIEKDIIEYLSLQQKNY